MMEKINLVELLKDCPKGMELDCHLFNGLEFDHIDTRNGNYPIICRAKSSKGEYHIHTFTKYGFYSDFLDYSKCVIFPKGKNTWEGFQRPFKDGDILTTKLGSIFIYHYSKLEKVSNKLICYAHTAINFTDKLILYDDEFAPYMSMCSFATEEERQKLFQAIKDEGYRWNAETKTLEKLITPKFKVGDIIQDKDSYKVKITAIDIKDRFYTYESLVAKGIGTITFKEQDDWVLVEYQVGDHFINPKDSELFVITDIQNDGAYDVQSLEGYRIFGLKKLIIDECLKTDKWNPKWLKPFDKVLVRDSQYDTWVATLFSHIGDSEHYPYVTTYINTRYCIPYNVETEHLVGTTLEEPEFYKL